MVDLTRTSKYLYSRADSIVNCGREELIMDIVLIADADFTSNIHLRFSTHRSQTTSVTLVLSLHTGDFWLDLKKLYLAWYEGEERLISHSFI